MHDSDRIYASHDCTMAESSAVFEDDDVSGAWAGHFPKAIGGEAEISLLATMQVPIFRVRTRIEWSEQPRIDEYANQ